MLAGMLIFLLVVIALLAIPVTLAFRVSWPMLEQNEFRLRWAFGLVRARVGADRSAPSQQREAAAATDRPEGSRRKRPSVLSAVRDERFRRRIIRFVGDAWRAIHKDDLRVHVRIGLGDPADTGRLWAIAGPVAGLLANSRNAAVSVEPDFLDSVVELDGSGSIRVVPLRMIGLVGALLLSPPFWQGLRLMRAGAK